MNVTAYTRNGSQQIELGYESFTFSGGEEHIRFTSEAMDIEKICITARLVNSASIIQLFMAVDALKRRFGARTIFELVCPYFPYARQDRVCVEGEAHGAAVMASMINSFNFDKVTIWDAHSDVSPALINNVVNLAQGPIIEKHSELAQALRNKTLTLIAPDAGASKKTQNVAKYFGGGIEVIQAEKVRDVKTGEITHTDIYGSVTGKDLLIVDDICDGGRTFIELAKVLKQKECSSISLFITHGIFSKGLDVFNDLIDNIYTTNSVTDFENQNETSSTNINTKRNTNVFIAKI